MGLPGQRPEGGRAELEWVWPRPSLATWFPEVVGEGRRGRTEELKALGFHMEEGSVLGIAPQLRPWPLGHTTFRLLPMSLGLLSPALEQSWSQGLLETEGWRRRGNKVAGRNPQGT